MRRERFIRLAGATLSLGVALPSCSKPPSVATSEASAAPSPGPALTAFITINPDETVTIFVPKSEMGQGVFTSLPVIVAEELDVPFSRVRPQFAPAENAYVDPAFKDMTTGGSTSVMDMWLPLREAGATARAMLIAAAAKNWSVEPASCDAREGVVTHAQSGRHATYGSLAASAAAMPMPAKVALKSPDRFTLIGRSTPRIDTPAKVAGTAQFGIDVVVPEMKYATVVHSPVFGGKAKSFDAKATRAVRGVRDVVQLDNGSVAVVADNTYAAFAGAKALTVEWDAGPNAHHSTPQLFAEAQTLVAQAHVAKSVGDPSKARGTVVEAIYRGPFLAHGAMEPMNATADVRQGSCEVWAPTQVQTRSKKAAMRVTGLSEDLVTIHTTFLGGGFGRRLDEDYVTEAVEISKKAAAPVKVLWTREEDMQHDFYRPMSLNAVRGVIDPSGHVVALEHTVVSPSILERWFPAAFKNGIDPQGIAGVTDVTYAIPNVRVAYKAHETGIPVGFMRAPGANWNIFVTESFIDELAHAAKADPLRFRLGLLSRDPRTKRVLELAAERSGWGSPLPAGTARGVALSFWNGSFGALVAEVSLKDKLPHVHRAVMAVDCGTVVDPAIVRAQVEGAINYGLGMAMTAKITIKNGRVEQNNFYDYTVLRQQDVPKIEVAITPSHEKPTGIGELGTPPIAPAVANAVFSLTGKRVRSLPFSEALAS